jgi:hypothetical protein
VPANQSKPGWNGPSLRGHRKNQGASALSGQLHLPPDKQGVNSGPGREALSRHPRGSGAKGLCSPSIAFSGHPGSTDQVSDQEREAQEDQYADGKPSQLLAGPSSANKAVPQDGDSKNDKQEETCV